MYLILHRVGEDDCDNPGKKLVYLLTISKRTVRDLIQDMPTTTRKDAQMRFKIHADLRKKSTRGGTVIWMPDEETEVDC